MHLYAILILSTAALSILADSEKFGMLVVRSGSPLQNFGIYSENGYLYLGKGNRSLSAVVTDCGFLRFDNGRYAVVQRRGLIKEGTKHEATGAFAVKNGHLTVFNSGAFEAIPKGEKYLFSTKATSSSLGLVIRAQAPSKGYTVPNFMSSNNCSGRTDYLSGLGTVSGNYSLDSKSNFSGGAATLHASFKNLADGNRRMWVVGIGAGAVAAFAVMML